MWETITGTIGDPPDITTIDWGYVGKLVKVLWHDAQTWVNAWLDSGDVAALELPECISYGVVIRDDAKAIYVSQTISGQEHRNLIGIPKASISYIEEIERR